MSELRWRGGRYAFLELPKLLTQRPTTGGASLWAWLFVHASELTGIPLDLRADPYREAVELANEASLSQAEMDAYRKVMEEIQQAREYGAAPLEKGKIAGKIEGKLESALAILAARDVRVNAKARAELEASRDLARLDRLLALAATATSVEALEPHVTSGSGGIVEDALWSAVIDPT